MKRLSRFLALAALTAMAVWLSGTWGPGASAQQVTSAPEITAKQTACDLLTVTVTASISHPELETGTYVLVIDNLDDDQDPAEFVIPTGQASFVETVDLDLPFEGATFLATLEIAGISDDPEDRLTIPETADTCASLTIVKDADGAGSRSFAFEVTGQDGVSLTDNGSHTYAGLEPGSYLVNEDPETGWTLADIDCTGASFRDEDIADQDVRVDLAANQDAVCIFTNVPTPTATATPVPTSTTTPIQLSQCEGANYVTRSWPGGTIVGSAANSPLCAAAPTATPVRAAITPPSTGDGGLVD